MKYNRSVFINFNNSSSSTASISVPSTVKTIHVKGMYYQMGNIPAAGTAQYITVVSNLTQNTPLGVVFEDSTYPINGFTDVFFDYGNPQVVQGNYTFSLLNSTGSAFVSDGNCNLIAILEFNTPDEMY